MLKILRKRKHAKAVLWILAIVIVPAFILWGTSTAIRTRRGGGYVGRIFGRPVTIQEYLNALKECRTEAKMIYGDKLSALEGYLNLEAQAWERLLLLKEAKRLRLKVSDEEVIEQIKDYKMFHRDGRFDNKTYQLIVGYSFGLLPREFEELMRNTLTIAKLTQQVTREVKVFEDDLQNAYKDEFEHAKLSYVLFAPKAFLSEIQPTDEELNSFYNAHKGTFKKPEQVNVEYLALEYGWAEANIKATEEELRGYFENHPDEFKDRKFEEALGDLTTRIIKRNAERKIESLKNTISDKLLNDVPLERLSQEYNIPLKETGYFSATDAIPDIGYSLEFVQAAFALKANEASDMIKTQRGYYCFRLKGDKKPPYIQSLNEVRDMVKQAVSSERAETLARQKADMALWKFKEPGKSYEEVAQELALPIKMSEPFTKQGYVQGLGDALVFSKQIFSLRQNETSDVIKTQAGYIIARLDKLEPYDQARFQKDKEEFREKVLSGKRAEYYSAWLEVLRMRARPEIFRQE